MSVNQTFATFHSKTLHFVKNLRYYMKKGYSTLKKLPKNNKIQMLEDYQKKKMTTNI